MLRSSVLGTFFSVRSLIPESACYGMVGAFFSRMDLMIPLEFILVFGGGWVMSL